MVTCYVTFASVMINNNSKDHLSLITNHQVGLEGTVPLQRDTGTGQLETDDTTIVTIILIDFCSAIYKSGIAHHRDSLLME